MITSCWCRLIHPASIIKSIPIGLTFITLLQPSYVPTVYPERHGQAIIAEAVGESDPFHRFLCHASMDEIC